MRKTRIWHAQRSPRVSGTRQGPQRLLNVLALVTIMDMDTLAPALKARAWAHRHGHALEVPSGAWHKQETEGREWGDTSHLNVHHVAT